jgi:hypothetical protein
MANIKVEATGDYPKPMFSIEEPNYAVDSSEGSEEISFEELLESLEEGAPADSEEEGELIEERPPDIELREWDDDRAADPGESIPLADIELAAEEGSGEPFVSEQDAQTSSLFNELMMEEEGMLPGAQVLLFKKDEEPDRETNWEDDNDHSKFIEYVANKLHAIPPHSGQTTVGCEKAISYLRKIDKEISKAIQSDENNVVSEEQAETLRDKIHDYVDQLEAAYDELVDNKRKKKKKKSSFSIGKKVVARINDGRDLQYFVSVANVDGEERLFKVEVEEPNDEQVQAFMAGEGEGITKEAGKLHVFVDPFLQSIKRLLIQSHIRQGKNIQDVYNQLNDQYNFTPREQLSIHELLLQSGLPLYADLGRIQEENVSPMDSRNVEFSTEFYS